MAAQLSEEELSEEKLSEEEQDDVSILATNPVYYMC